MAKTSGGVRGGSRSFSRDAHSMFDRIASGYGRKIDFSGHDTKKLQSLLREGKSYNSNERAKAIQAYTSYASRVTGGSYRSIGHSSLEAARSELIRVAHRAGVYRNLDAIKAELRRRRAG